jgi:hypothetical protein
VLLTTKLHSFGPKYWTTSDLTEFLKDDSYFLPTLQAHISLLQNCSVVSSSVNRRLYIILKYTHLPEHFKDVQKTLCCSSLALIIINL